MSSIDEDQIQIDKRLYHLVKCLEITDDCLKYKMKICKNVFQEKLNRFRLFSPVKLDINKLEMDLNDKFEKDIVKKKVQAPINQVKNDIIKLISDLKTISQRRDGDLFYDLDKIDLALNKLESSIQLVQAYDEIDKKVEEFLRPTQLKYQKYFDDLERERNYYELNDESQSKYQIEQINKEIKLLNIDKDDYKKWLLIPASTNDSISSTVNSKTTEKQTQDVNNDDVNNIDDLNFEIINYNQLEAMEVLTDFELDDDDEEDFDKNRNTNKKLKNKESCDVSSSSSSESLFSDIRSMPLDHWLLK